MNTGAGNGRFQSRPKATNSRMSSGSNNIPIMALLPFRLQSDGADDRQDKNVGKRDARKGPAQCALQPCSHMMVSRHTRIPFAYLNLPGEGRKWGVRPNPGGFSDCLFAGALSLPLPESGCQCER